MALDYGRKRVGVAVCDALGITVTPLAFLPMHKGVAKDIQRIIQERSIEEIILGLPLNMQGEDSAMTQEVRAFGQTLQDMVSIPVHLYDERLTSQQAEQMLIENKQSRQKRKTTIDSAAAAVLLRAYLEEHG